VVKKGRKEESDEVIKKMLKNGLGIEAVANILELDPDVVKNVKRSLDE